MSIITSGVQLIAKNFTDAEMRCKCASKGLSVHSGFCGGQIRMDEDFLRKLQHLRLAFARPLPVTSGYRCAAYDNMVSGKSGAHRHGVAVDIAIHGGWATHELIRLAMAMGFVGIGIKARGDGRFVHLDDWQEPNVRPALWSY